MPKSSNQKLKLIYLMKILLERTDETHSITMPEMIDALAAYGISAERKSLYNDIENLRVYGLDIIGIQEDRTYSYHIGNRQFELAELKLLVDSVQSAKFITVKKSNELMAHAYSKLYNIPSTGLRFFTVYGPAGRPDMAYFGFTNKLVNGETIKIFNYGNCKRDFTYVDDIVEGVVRVMAKAPEKKNGEDGLPIPPYAVYNIGNSNPENLLDFVQILSEELVRAGVLPADYDFEAHKELVPMQPGDVPVTFADTEPLERDFGFKPHTPLREGLRKFAEWYKEFYME
jgi:nucleoside-diphosphate-sugar epimerase